jgi:hypothetical protein
MTSWTTGVCEAGGAGIHCLRTGGARPPVVRATLAFFHVVVVMYEEPTLKQAFGMEYESFRTDVPRWIPPLTPWRAE